MKTLRLTGLFLSTIAAFSVYQAAAQPITLSSYPGNVYTNTFDSMGYSTNITTDGTPTGPPGTLAGEWTCYLNAKSTAIGTIASPAPNVSGGAPLAGWRDFTGEFKNFASYFSYIGGTNFNGTNENTTATIQTNEPNRALGIRQTSAVGDSGAAFVLKLHDTVNFHDFAISLDMLNLDPTSPRTTTWTIDYGFADPVVGVPSAFFPIATYVNTPTTTFHQVHTNITFPDGTIDNFNGQVWIRVVTLTPSSGSGNRQSFAIDNFGMTWVPGIGSGGCTDPSITGNPASTSAYTNGTAVFTVNAGGTPPRFYQWRFNGTDVSTNGTNPQVGNTYRAFQLSLNNVTADNAGSYDCIISNACSSVVVTSQVAVLTVTNAPLVSIGYLRTLTDPANLYAPTNTTQFYQATGIITTFTNIVAAGNGTSYYLQDATGGINLFVTGGSAFKPNLGDEVTAIGFLSGFGGSLELEADLTQTVPANNATYVTILSNNIANYPVANLLSWPTEFAVGVTNKTVEQGTTNGLGQFLGVGSKKGSFCILTNVYFGTNAGKILSTLSTGSVTNLFVTNSAGLKGWLSFPVTTDHDLTNQPLPSFAYSVAGELIAATPTYWSAINVSKFADIVSTPLTLSVTHSGSSSTITWTAVPQTYSYTVLGSTSVAGPYVPIAAGLRFSDANGSYTDTSASGPYTFYRVTSP